MLVSKTDKAPPAYPPIPGQFRVQGTMAGQAWIQALGTGCSPQEQSQPWNQPVGRRPQADTGPSGLVSLG